MPFMTDDLIEKDETLPFLMNHLPDFVIEKAKVELNESTEKIIKSLQELKSLAGEHSVTCDINFVDDYLLQYLRKRKYDVAKAFKQLVTMTKLRTKSSFLFRKIDLDKYFCYPAAKFFTVLPRRCPDGCAIVLFELGKWNPEEFPIEEAKTLGSTLFCQSIRDPMTQVHGYKAIFDCYNIPFMNIRYLTPQNIYLFYHGALECVPGRYKEMIVLINSRTMKLIWAIFSGFATQKLRDRMFVKSFPEDLLEHFPPSVLPVQYGGELTDYYMTEWMEKANEQQGKFPLGGQKNYY